VAREILRPAVLVAEDELGDGALRLENHVRHSCLAPRVALDLRFDAGRFRLGLGLAGCQGTTEGLLVALPGEAELLAQAGNLGAVGRLLNARLVETLHRLG